MDDLIYTIKDAQIRAGENAVIESLKAKGFFVDPDFTPKIIEKGLLNEAIPLHELARVLPTITYKRIVKNLMTDNGFTNITKFAKANGYSKQFISKVINKDVRNTLKFNIMVVKDGLTTWVKRID